MLATDFEYDGQYLKIGDAWSVTQMFRLDSKQ